MSLDLDDRQRAMLHAMGIHVWWPSTDAPQALSVPKAPAAQNARPAAALASAPQPPGVKATPVAPSRTLANAPSGQSDWPQLGKTIAACTACGLCEGRKAPVFVTEAVPRQADWLIVGEPPDELEERALSPFAGEAGTLLDNMLRAVQVHRGGSGSNGARLTNVVKCRPGLARNPVAGELAACAVHLWREVDLVQPRVILAMGRFAASSLLAQSHPELLALPFGKLRGTIYRVRGVPLVVTHHPSRLLRAQADKALAWADLCLAQTATGKAGPADRP